MIPMNHLMVTMNYGEALEYLDGLEVFGIRLGLERIGYLLKRLGSPESRLNIIHVAGTNGKGSVCAIGAVIVSPFAQFFCINRCLGDICAQSVCALSRANKC